MPKRLTNRSTNACLGLAHDYLVQAIDAQTSGNRRDTATCLRLASEYLRKGKREIAARAHGKDLSGNYHADRWDAEYRDQFEAVHDAEFVDVYGEVI